MTDADADAVTTGSNTRSYTLRSVASSPGWSHFQLTDFFQNKFDILQLIINKNEQLNTWKSFSGKK